MFNAIGKIVVASILALVLLVFVGVGAYCYMNPPNAQATSVEAPPEGAPAGNAGTGTVVVVENDIVIGFDGTGTVSTENMGDLGTDSDAGDIARDAILVIGHTDAKIQEVAGEMSCPIEQYVRVSNLSALAQIHPAAIIHLIHAQLNTSDGAVDFYFRAGNWQLVDNILVEGMTAPWAPSDAVVTTRETLLEWQPAD